MQTMLPAPYTTNRWKSTNHY